MDWKERIRNAVLAATEPDPAPRSNVSRMDKRRLSSEDVGEMLHAAEHRDNPLFEEMDNLLNELAIKYPFKTIKLRADIAWLRRQAYKAGRPWGKKRSWR